MLAFEWNALRVGDGVLLHVRNGEDFPLAHGVVAFVDGRRGENDVRIRLRDGEHEGHVVRPARMATHLEPFSRDEACWRCGRRAASA